MKTRIFVFRNFFFHLQYKLAICSSTLTYGYSNNLYNHVIKLCWINIWLITLQYCPWHIWGGKKIRILWFYNYLHGPFLLIHSQVLSRWWTPFLKGTEQRALNAAEIFLQGSCILMVFRSLWVRLLTTVASVTRVMSSSRPLAWSWCCCCFFNDNEILQLNSV